MPTKTTTTLSAALGSSSTKDDSVNFQLPGFYFSKINREIDRQAEPVTFYVVFFSLGDCETRGEVVRHTLLVKVIEEHSALCKETIELLAQKTISFFRSVTGNNYAKAKEEYKSQ